MLLGLGLARVPTEALMYRAFLPGLGLWRGSQAYLSSNFAGQLLPPPTASVVQYGYFRGGRLRAGRVGARGVWLVHLLRRSAGSCFRSSRSCVLLVTGEVNDTVRGWRALSLAITAVAGIAGYLFLRGERSARWVGAKAQRPLSWILVKFERDRIEDGAGKATELRPGARRPAGGLGAGVDRRRGQPLRHLPDPARLPSLRRRLERRTLRGRGVRRVRDRLLGRRRFPITGSGLGVVDAVLIAMLIELSSADDDALVAAALLWRVFYSIIPLPLGAITLSRFRKANPEALRHEAAETT